jgi:hypothetical protein
MTQTTIPPDQIDAAADQVEKLLNGFSDHESRAKAQELVRVMMELYGTALGSILEIVRQSGDSKEWLFDRLAEDKLIASLMLVHGLHPVDAETRIRRALSRIERFVETHRLVFGGLVDGTAKVRVEPENGAQGGPPTALAGEIERAIRQSAPEVERVEIAGAAPVVKLVQIGPAQGR